MTITIEVPPDLEEQIRQVAAQAGLAPEVFITEVIRERVRLGVLPTSVPRLAKAESDLLHQINTSLAGFDWSRYHDLIARRKNEVLTEDEQRELIDLSNQIEEANVRRIGHLVELAHLRAVGLDVLIADLGLQPTTHA